MGRCIAVFSIQRKGTIAAGYGLLVLLLLGLYYYKLKHTFSIVKREENVQEEKQINSSFFKGSNTGFTRTKCQKKHNIFFNKVPKCASTTMTNIFLRFAYNNNLSVVIPKRGKGYFTESNALLEMEKWNRTPDDKYNIFCFHWPFNRTVAEKIMHKDTVYVATLREPIARYISHYYFRVRDNHQALPIDEHIQEMERTHNRLVSVFESNDTFGYEIPATNLPEYLDKLNSMYHLVMIAEFLDESLVLMRETLCWSMMDIVYVRSKVSATTQSQTKLSNRSYAFLSRQLQTKQIVYNYFLKRFQEQIENFGKTRVEKEIAKLRSLCSFWQNYCIQTVSNYRNLLTEKGKKHPFCQQLVLNEDREATRQKQGILIKNGHKFPS